MTVIKRDRKTSSADLISAIDTLVPLLESQDEVDACKALNIATNILKSAEPGSKQHQLAIEAIIDAFEGEHELMAYTHQRKTPAGEWTEAEELSNASSRVLSLARRMRQP
jgi:hypothetical protein